MRRRKEISNNIILRVSSISMNDVLPERTDSRCCFSQGSKDVLLAVYQILKECLLLICPHSEH